MIFSQKIWNMVVTNTVNIQAVPAKYYVTGKSNNESKKFSHLVQACQMLASNR